MTSRSTAEPGRRGGESCTTVRQVELYRLELHRTTVHRAAYGAEARRPVVLVRVTTDDGVGWGECAALASPSYRSEFADGAWMVLERFLVPAVLGASVPIDPLRATWQALADAWAAVAGHAMAKAALEMAVLDAVLRAQGQSLADALGIRRATVEAGVVLGLVEDAGAARDELEQAAAAGFRRARVKIAAGRKVAPVAQLRGWFPNLAIAADANGSYRRDDDAELALVDALGLAAVEQPLAADDLLGHVELAERWRTPVALDESIASPSDVELVGTLGAASIVCLKPACLGGVGPAIDAHDRARSLGLHMWCGGMLQTALGRAVDAAVSGMDGFDLAGDLGGPGRPFEEEDPFGPVPIVDGSVVLHRGPGVGPEPDAGLLSQVVTRHVTIHDR